MTKVTIYYFSRKKFLDNIPDDYTTLSELVRKDDFDRKSIKVVHYIDGQSHDEMESKEPEKEVIINLVIDSDEYSGIQEHAIINFSNFLKTYDIENIFIQNPPKKIEEQITKLINEDVKIEKQEYANITQKNIIYFYEKFSENIYGQLSAQKRLTASLVPLLIKDREKPVVILLYGGSGIGKTESVKLLSKIVNEPLMREQFSMYQNEEFSKYLFGGSHSEKSFAKDLLDRESNIILLDEFDKANPLFYSAFYQLFDEGIFVDRNYELELKKSVIICTSNFNSINEIEKVLGNAIFSRFDSIIHFSELDDIAKIKIGNQLFDEISLNYYQNFGTKVSQEIIDRLKNNYINCDNARQIRGVIEDTLSFYYMDKLLK